MLVMEGNLTKSEFEELIREVLFLSCCEKNADEREKVPESLFKKEKE